jgi:hypothetical protein
MRTQPAIKTYARARGVFIPKDASACGLASAPEDHPQIVPLKPFGPLWRQWQRRVAALKRAGLPETAAAHQAADELGLLMQRDEPERPGRARLSNPRNGSTT